MAAPPTPGQPRLLRLINDRTALDLLLELGPLSRVQICDLTGLSKPTASRLLARLEEAGLVRAVGTSSGGPGRNAVLYAVHGPAAHVAAVNVTRLRITAQIADLTGAVLAEANLPIRSSDHRAPASLVQHALTTAGDSCGVPLNQLHSVTLSVPGAYDVDEDRVTLVEGLLGWGAPGALVAVRAALAPATVLVENDVNLAAVAERRHGVGGSTDSFAVLWVSTGLGLAIDLGGRLHRGATGGAGEIGYMQLLSEAPDRPPIRFQDMVGAPAVRALARKHGIPGRSAPQIVEKACATSDTASSAFLDELASRLASGLAVITSVLDPHLIVLSGDTCAAGGQTLARRVQRALRRVSKLRPALMVSGVHGNPALVGALELSLHHTRDALFRATAAEPVGNVR
ncbi:MAG TPA: ROK family transcriptional regulator [Kineosporiaceae bacterium]|nr:ROK family transcriptional regulator [Kineosporiaceae bacterium]